MTDSKGHLTETMFDKQIYEQGYQLILGMDEAGRGAWAGPVAVGAVCLPLADKNLRKSLNEVRDSKTLSALQRDRMAEAIRQVAIAWGVGSASNEEIDTYGINPSTRLAMQRALEDAKERFPGFEPQCLFLDALIWPEMLNTYPQVTIVDGDARSLNIAAASILAKTWRDQVMDALDAELPLYGFATHKGYGTKNHQAALLKHGPSLFHRTSYAPVGKLLKGPDD